MGKGKHMKRGLSLASCIILLVAFGSRAQNYPATIQVPIDIYDFHSDGSCPDFNVATPGHNAPNGWVTGMVQNKLDVDGLPVRGTNLLFSYEIGKWWRLWRQGNDYDRPIYANNGTTLQQLSNAQGTVYADSSYKNLLVQQNLTFVSLGNGFYQYKNPNFFPLDAGGFQAGGKAPDPTYNWDGTPIDRNPADAAYNGHNYSSATHIKRPFKYVNSQPGTPLPLFEFRGDDDMWVFINKTLVLDLGGIHQTTHGSFELGNGNAYVWEAYNSDYLTDTATASKAKPVINLGLVDGSTDTIDIFYCERQAFQSDIEVTTNIITATPSAISMSVVPPGDTVVAGNTKTYTASIKQSIGSDTSSCDQCSQNVHWSVASYSSLSPLVPIASSSFLTPVSKIGQKNTFNAITAYTWNIVSAKYDTSINGQVIHLAYFDTVYVLPGPATHLNIEGTSDSTQFLRQDNRLGQLVFPSATQKNSVYAILRDAYGNFVSHDLIATWNSRDATIVTVASGNKSIGEGVITRQTPNNATTMVLASDVNGFSDSLKVILSNVNYSKIQIVVRGNIAIDTLQIRTDQDTLISAIGLRADGSGIWDPIQVSWGNSAGLVANPKAPTTPALSWRFTPVTAGTGKISIFWGSGAQLVSDSIVAIFAYGIPNHMALYPAPGTPDVGTNFAYPAVYTVQAGQVLPLVAKLFSSSNQWLSYLESPTAPITWTISDPTSATFNGTTTGFQVSFTGIKAYQTVKVTATYSQGGVVVSQSMMISITPGPAAKLVIEPDTLGNSLYENDLLGQHRAGSVTIAGTATSVPVYAVLRDKYGNFVGFSQPTTWIGRDTTTVVPLPGNVFYGQGIMTRKVNSGQAVVVAQDGVHTSFTDSVLVIISPVSYTALRIVVLDSTVITSLGMTIDMDTTLKVEGLRSDGQGWEYVKANWSATAGLQNATAGPTSSISWDIAPKDTGHAWVKVSLTGATPDSILVTIGAGVPKYIVLYPAEGAPGSTNMAYPDPSQVILDSAGKALPVVAKVFDKANDWLSSFETSSSPVSWTIVEGAGNTDIPTGVVAPLSGDKTTLSATRANNTILVIGSFVQSGQTYRDSIKVTVVPGKPNHLSLEPTSDASASPHKDNPADTVSIAQNQNNGVVYAVIRDQYGNYISASQSTGWLSRDTTIVTVTDGLASIGQGVITKVLTAQGDHARVLATSLVYSGLKDSTMAVVLKYYYTALRIVNAAGTAITNLTMNTNQDTTVQVQGLRSDGGGWEQVYGVWTATSGLSTVPGAPSNAATWSFSPDKPGTGTISVTLGDTTKTTPAHIPANFTVGPPILVETQILTPANLLIAGDTIVAVTRIKNKDGLVPGVYCDPAVVYKNALVSPTGTRPNPTVDSTTMGTTMDECFQNGIDTVKYVLYYAPADKDSMEKVMVTLEGLSASSDPFVLNPGALARISLEDFNGNHIDSIHLNYPTDSKLILAVGYDKYGNLRGPENSNWGVSGNLHSVDNSTNVPRVYYTSDPAKGDESGYIHASAIGIGGATVSDSTPVTITGPLTYLVTAVTRDSSGDGYLDQIVLHFNKPATIPAASQITITYGNGKYVLPVSSVRGLTSSTADSVIVVTLVEPKSSDPDYGIPETDWQPSVTVTGLSGVKPITNYVATDGAGPVVWSVVKTISAASTTTDHSQDKVTVTFSEPIGTAGGDFKTVLAPDSVFRVWVRTTTAAGKDTMVENAAMLSGIISGFQVENSTTVSFYMTNGNDLTSYDYINLSVDSTGKHITDKNPPLVNPPVATNQKVQVQIKSGPPTVVRAVPNPTGPTFVHERAGTFTFVDNPQARDWVRTERAGAVITFQVANTGEVIKGKINIYDAVGNLVAQASVDNVLARLRPSATASGSIYNYDLYWNGSNMNGEKVAPGAYAVRVSLSNSSKPLWTTVGMAY
jgi:fibro-slime domain-containing protein